MLTYSVSLRSLAVSLAVLAGFVDAIAFLQLGGFFVSFMSGNSTRLGVGLASAPDAAFLALLLIGSFVSGVVCGSLLGRAAGSRQKGMVLAAVAACLVAAALTQHVSLLHVRSGLLAFAMGATNAVFQRDGESRFGVTYMTGALVKLGQGLAAALTGGPRWAWTNYLLLWGGLVIGAGAGATAHALTGGQALWAAGGLATLLAILNLKPGNRPAVMTDA